MGQFNSETNDVYVYKDISIKIKQNDLDNYFKIYRNIIIREPRH